ncbi:hypothetical protein DXG01_009036, partial [Tephrocybe rancida]
AHKPATQNNRVLFPALEVPYIFQVIAHAPCAVVKLSQYGDSIGLDVEPVSAKSTQSLSTLQDAREEDWEGGDTGAYESGVGEYWDDFCLVWFLEGVCLRFIAYPDHDAVLDPEVVVDIPPSEAGGEEPFRTVFEYGFRNRRG